MNRVIYLSEIIGTIEDGSVEVCATADAEYDPFRTEVSVALDAYARRVVAAGDGHHFAEPWLPRAEKVKEHLPREEASSFARDVFRTWLKRVHASIPAEVMLRT